MRRQRMIWILAILIVGILVDQATKEVARRTLMDQGRLSYLGDTLRLQYSENDGAFLGLGSQLPAAVRFWVFTVAVGITMLILFLYTWKSRTLTLGQTIAFACILSGGTSNLLDRIYADGRVTDFLNVGIGGLRTGIFNVADMAVLGGCLWLIFFGGREAAKEAVAEGT